MIVPFTKKVSLTFYWLSVLLFGSQDSICGYFFQGIFGNGKPETPEFYRPLTLEQRPFTLMEILF
jgi:hypothetical protein